MQLLTVTLYCISNPDLFVTQINKDQTIPHRHIQDRQIRDITPVYELANAQKQTRKNYNLLNFNQFVETLTLGPIGQFYDLISHTKMFPMSDWTAETKDKLINCFVEIQHLTEII